MKCLSIKIRKFSCSTFTIWVEMIWAWRIWHWVIRSMLAHLLAQLHTLLTPLLAPHCVDHSDILLRSFFLMFTNSLLLAHANEVYVHKVNISIYTEAILTHSPTVHWSAERSPVPHDSIYRLVHWLVTHLAFWRFPGSFCIFAPARDELCRISGLAWSLWCR